MHTVRKLWKELRSVHIVYWSVFAVWLIMPYLLTRTWYFAAASPLALAGGWLSAYIIRKDKEKIRNRAR